MSDIYTTVSIYEPRAKEMSLDLSTELKTSFLFLSHTSLYFALGADGSDLAAEAAAMDRLAELATSAAAHLREAAAARTAGAEVSR
ncbi:hypothetical protein DI270_013395 [Microbispora triticiradicis]|uniref:Uncharacterized protein n=1 Tax=Microbispora triticiradicis TaxID=2200763 RepID=A0ABX9LKH6_9ACTN|nr:hypothetical protein [Microbispora triticiradicis]RGA04482.1 hypothetical protein DI270_013395 [Microbispora triticiradicis]